jgi:ubiquinone/menaquinone biosynthesis C-methylase UbiE
MADDPARCFDMMAADARWSTFSAEERDKVDAFTRRWRIRPGDRVLEPGCGSGRLTVILADLAGPRGHVLAFDASPRLMKIAEARNLPAHVTLRVDRAETLPLAPASFDHIVCFNVFPHLVPHQAIAERLSSALRPGGRFWIAHTRGRETVNAVHASGPAFLSGHLLPAPPILERLLSAAGLESIEIEDGPDRFLASARRVGVRPSSRSGCDA